MMQTLPFPCYNPSFLLYLESSVIFLALPFGHLGVHSLTSRWESFLPVSLVLLWRWQGLCDPGGEWRWGPWAEGWQRVWALHEDPSWAPMWPAGPPCCLCLGTVPLLGECSIPPPSHRSSPHPVSTPPHPYHQPPSSSPGLLPCPAHLAEEVAATRRYSPWAPVAPRSLPPASVSALLPSCAEGELAWLSPQASTTPPSLPPAQASCPRASACPASLIFPLQ